MWYLILSLLLIPTAFTASAATTFRLGYPAMPRSLLAFLADDELSLGIDALVLETLVSLNPRTHRAEPALARRWRESSDHLRFTFEIDPAAKFSDGSAVTARDVSYSLNALLDLSHHTEHYRAEYEGMAAKIEGPLTVTVSVPRASYVSLEKFAYLFILPEREYAAANFNRAFNKSVRGSGPYRLQSWSLDALVLEKNSNYWGQNLKANLGKFYFSKIVLRILPEFFSAFESLQRHEIDYLYFLSSKMWHEQTSDGLFKSGQLKKLTIANRVPAPVTSIVWNNRRDYFNDRATRRALDTLVNRDVWNRNIFLGEYVSSQGIFSTASPYHDPTLHPAFFSPRAAEALLTRAGWQLNPHDGQRYRRGRRFDFEMAVDNPALQKVLTLYQQDLKRVGISMRIRLTDRVTLVKRSERFDFDARIITTLREVNPGHLSAQWGSPAADIPGSENLSGYKNAELDRIIKKFDETLVPEERFRYAREIENVIARDVPVSLTWESPHQRVAYWNTFSFVAPGYDSYSDWKNAFFTWHAPNGAG